MTPKEMDRLSNLSVKTDQPWTEQDVALVLRAFREADPAIREKVLDHLRASVSRKEALHLYSS
jgi:hypothetical protein